MFVAVIWILHRVFDSFALRSLAVSCYQAGLAAAIGHAVLATSGVSGYVRGFILSMCAAIAGGHLFRGVRFLVDDAAPASLLQPAGWNNFFLAAGAFSLPVLTLGGLLIAHRAIVTLAEHAANRDFLTGIWSRRAFFEIGEREVARARRTGRPLCVMLLDVDRLKDINDTHGHAAGDQALCVFADRVGGTIRDIDCFARLGGDEFVVALPETDLAGASLAAERLRERFNQGVPVPGWPDVTASIGVALLKPSDTLHSLLQRADAALYDSKSAGRNRITTENVVAVFPQHAVAANRS